MLSNIFNILLGIIAVYWSKVLADWPGESYALPRPIDGCPMDWKEGMRYQDSENVLNINSHSTSYHLSGTVNKHGIRQEFCTKTDDSRNNITWPPGQYCIYKYGMNCPEGLMQGWIFWDDENDEFIDASSLYGGYIPSGIYEADTLIYTCCRTDGNKNIPVSLPTSMPFYLLAYGSEECQKVIGASVTSEFVQWDDEDKGNRNDNSRVVPFAVKKNRWNTRIYFCYYEFRKSSICGVNGATCENTTQYDTSQAAKSAVITDKEKKSELPGLATTTERTSGIAVVIGSSIAAGIVGTASLIFVVRHFLNKKAEALGNPGDGDDEEEEVFPMPDEMW